MYQYSILYVKTNTSIFDRYLPGWASITDWETHATFQNVMFNSVTNTWTMGVYGLHISRYIEQ
jgi:hypothetical protein